MAVDEASVGACNCKEDSFVLDDTIDLSDLSREILNLGDTSEPRAQGGDTI